MSVADNKTSVKKASAGAIFVPSENGGGFRLEGRLDAGTTGGVWIKATRAFKRLKERESITIDASGLVYCDGAGIALLLELQRLSEARGATLEIRGLAEKSQNFLGKFKPDEFEAERRVKERKISAIVETGQAFAAVLRDMRDLVTFTGELMSALAHSALHPRQVRWRDAWVVAETAGANALPLVLLVGFIIGLVMAFQAAILTRQYGLEILVADLVALSMLRELGPLVTCLILAGRSSSAFAAELGTMKVNEEIDAMNTMGLDPVRFLVVTRVVTVTLMTPILVIFANFAGIFAGALVLLSMGHSLSLYVSELGYAISLTDLMGGLLKSVVFGFFVAGVGCMRGLQTKTGATAVGTSTTSAVVSSIILVALLDAMFSIIYFYLDI